MIPTQKRKTVPIKAIILTIVGAFIGTAIVVFLVYYHLRRRKKQEGKFLGHVYDFHTFIHKKIGVRCLW